MTEPRPNAVAHPAPPASPTNADHIAVGIVADDLTGGGDSAVQFARDGWRTRLLLTAPDSGLASHGTVLAVVSDARAQPALLARPSTSEAVVALGNAGVNRLLLKIDSTMRGSAHAQILGALDAWQKLHTAAFAVVCPAYPAMNRTVQNGRVLVNGQGVETTAAGTDPVTPVTTNLLSELVPGSVHVALDNGTASDHAKQLRVAAQNPTRVVTVDAATDADILTLAEAVALLGPEAIPVGSAGLAVALSRVWCHDLAVPAEPAPVRAARVVVVLSSLHDISRSQYDHLVGVTPPQHVRTFAPSLNVFLEPGAIGLWIAGELAATPHLPAIVIVATPSERPDAATAPTTTETGTETGTETAAETATVIIADGLATITAALFAHRSVGALVLMGGEGARAVLNRFDAGAIVVTDAIREGIPVGLIDGGLADGLTVVTKAGGFGATSSIADILPQLLADHVLSPTANPNTGVHP
ncbi:four-carbon acid sugar kinase family protein [Cryobacterium ruanii]|uniref:Four-carbon acid sugar kinase family protein n=1 Tax=Cryobacterium ruanii TaxID=1259197 RepID=A0A4R9AMD8_9MICO|nr:four-carbon acid sugar kinase family protein [Cryobacterium ruanii]TFD65692.1 four-carbon acid sugar kinase family protein [Cryobacterium ruanii]